MWIKCTYVVQRKEVIASSSTETSDSKQKSVAALDEENTAIIKFKVKPTLLTSFKNSCDKFILTLTMEEKFEQNSILKITTVFVFKG